MEENSKRQKRQKVDNPKRSVQVHLGSLGENAVSRTTIETGKQRRYDCTSGKDFDKNIQSREINDGNEEEIVPKVKRKSFVKKWKKEIKLLEGVANVLATPKALQGKTPSSFDMYVDCKLKQMEARSRTITEKRIMDILFEVEMGTTCARPRSTVFECYNICSRVVFEWYDTC